MITRIEIDGFKTFQDFAVDLAPFQVIIGANGSGKSNFFDALHFMSLLATEDLDTAFQGVREQTHELFTILPNGTRADRMHFVVEMLVNIFVQDRWGEQADLTSPRLRYNLEIGRRSDEYGRPQLFVLSESMEPIPRVKDHWMDRFGGKEFADWLYSANHTLPIFINTANVKDGTSPTIYLTPDRSNAMPERSDAQTRQEGVGFQAGKMKRTLLSRVDTVDYAHAFAARREMQQWRFLFLNPDLLRLPGQVTGNANFVGNNLPAVFARMKSEDAQLLTKVSLSMANMVSTIKRVDVERNQSRNVFEIFAETKDGRRFYMPSLSDGTVRLIALAILNNDPQHRGVLCLEEPENGVHPGALKRLVRMLREAASDFSEPEQAGHLQQLLVSTHSPELVSHLDIESGELLFATMATRVVPSEAAWQVTRMMPVCPDAKGSPERAYALSKVIEYLANPEATEKRDSLHEALLR